jgi:hypothetical protein
MRRIFFNSRGLRAGWRLLIFVGIFVGLGFLANWIMPKIFHPKERPFLDPVGTIVDELQALIQVLIATWIMARIERRRFPNYAMFEPSHCGYRYLSKGWISSVSPETSRRMLLTLGCLHP